ncbi:anthrax toxin lethal factor-related metalloendopeptidase [Schinkia azotoformans]|uniref:anthrax toxin lethal factor-related metalloendopeptidase n=1 Tax=Schinkia azotoformans TaxID=1454 RepID=UPI002DBFFF30|nr:hypothetical protein [Schinkia azotoformans]MEC1772913.1 hypothetical protein [Schinkia azotoformans]MED4369225.1 hypothetical protein [Schinkia azotoformans]
MKKIFILFISITLILSVQDYAEGKTLGVSLVDENLKIETNDKYVGMLLGELILLPDDNNYDKTNALEMINTLSQINPTILNFLTENNLKVKLFNGKLTDEPSFQNLKGTVPRGWNNGLTWDDVPGGCAPTLALAKIGSSQTGMGHSSVNLELHEVGHLFERNYQKLRDNMEYIQIWKEEAPKLMPGRDYFSDYQDEFFAEAFAMYYYGPNTREVVKQVAPNTYSLISDIENSPVLI